ncbi:tRNA-specific adenosine deaminase [Clostridia bacterium]|nr:tRNA-specific adenosine deaminase [Clostridia bacterium]
MEKAYNEALKAYRADETPIGCVIVCGGAVIGAGHNLRNTNKNCLAHAEILAINEACGKTGDWRLEDAVLYVTVEPCPMCAGAILQARIKTLVFGAYNKKAGCAGSVTNIFALGGFNHTVEVRAGVSSEKCAALMSDFFRKIRNAKLV